MTDALIKLPADAFAKKARFKASFNSWLKARDVGKYLIRKSDDGGDDLVGFDHDVAVHIIPNLMTKPGTYDADGNELTAPKFSGPHLMVKFLSQQAQEAFVKQRTKPAVMDRFGKENAPAEYDLPTGVSTVKNPGTVAWL
jgi:hypothetical protein